MEFLAEKSKSKSPGEQGICSARPLSVLSLMFVHLPPSAEVEVEPQPTESPLASPPARCQQPVSHTPRKAGRVVSSRPQAQGHEPDRSIAPSMSLLRLGRLPFVSYSYHYQPGRACSHAISQPRTRSCMRRFLTAATVDDVL